MRHITSRWELPPAHEVRFKFPSLNLRWLISIPYGPREFCCRLYDPVVLSAERVLTDVSPDVLIDEEQWLPNVDGTGAYFSPVFGLIRSSEIPSGEIIEASNISFLLICLPFDKDNLNIGIAYRRHGLGSSNFRYASPSGK